MPDINAGYLIGLGSNIEPEANVINMLDLLLRCFSPIQLSRVISIPPVGMNSHRYFLNAVLFLETDMSMDELKQLCNQIETSLGRDRTDPDSKYKDRPADLDILAHLSTLADWEQSPSEITDEYFLFPLIDELKHFLGKACETPSLQNGISLTLNGSAFGEAATTIHRD